MPTPPTVMRAWFRNDGGTVAMIYVFAFFVMLLGAGAMVDYQRVTSLNSRLFRAVELAARAGAGAAGQRHADPETLARSTFAANLADHQQEGITLHVSVGASEVHVVASTAVAAPLLALIGISEIPVVVEFKQPIVHRPRELDEPVPVDRWRR